MRLSLVLVLLAACIPAKSDEFVDAGDSRDTGTKTSDAGTADAGTADADAATADAGTADAGFVVKWTTPKAVREGVWYHVYVRSFADSAPDSGLGPLAGDGIGDLPGLTSRLDYIASLGVTGVMLLPLFVDQTPETGGYLTIDHLHIAPEYGGDAAWADFITQARARHLQVMMDLSFSVVSTKHPWFLAAQSALDAADRERFVRSRDGGACPVLGNQGRLADGGITNGWAPFDASTPDDCYWCDYSPQTCAAPDVTNPAVEQAFIDVATYWLARGADGFRLDSAQSLAQVTARQPRAKNLSSPATHAFVQHFMTALKQARADAFVLAELFDPTGYFDDGVDLGTDYLTWLGLVWSWQHGLASSGAPQNAGVAELMPYQVALRTPRVWGAGFLGNHDAPGHNFAGFGSGRIADLFCPLPCTDVAPLRAAAQLQLALPATPFIYFGEELGLHGAPDLNGQQWSRNPMQWQPGAGRGFTTGTAWTPISPDTANVADQKGTPGSMLESYRALIAKRRESQALSAGTFTPVTTTSPLTFAFVRAAPSERILVVTNFGQSVVSATVDLSAVNAGPGPVTEVLFGLAQTALTADNVTHYPVALLPKSTLWLRLP